MPSAFWHYRLYTGQKEAFTLKKKIIQSLCTCTLLHLLQNKYKSIGRKNKIVLQLYACIWKEMYFDIVVVL